MPSLFFFTCAVLAYDSRRLAPLVAVVLMASVFKETGLCTALLILFGAHWEIRKRVALFVAIVVVSFAIRKALLWGYSVHTAFLPFNEATGTFDFITKAVENVRVNVIELFQFHLNSAFFANCGMLPLMFIFSWKTPRDRLFKLVAAVFVAGQFCFGILHEFREWYELLPLGLMIFSERFEEK